MKLVKDVKNVVVIVIVCGGSVFRFFFKFIIVMNLFVVSLIFISWVMYIVLCFVSFSKNVNGLKI